LLKDEIIPNSVKFYTAEVESLAPLEDLFGDMGLDGEEGEEDDEEESGVKFDDPNVQKLNRPKGSDPECKNQ